MLAVRVAAVASIPNSHCRKCKREMAMKICFNVEIRGPQVLLYFLL